MGHTLILLRHGKSDWSVPASDARRPLAPRGRRQAAEAGRWIAEHAPPPDLAVVSPAVRASATWAAASAELVAPPPTRVEDQLYASSTDEPLAVVRSLGEELSTVVLVGHNPALEDLIEALTGAWPRMTTSAIAVVAMPGRWEDAGDGTAGLLASGRPPAPYDGTSPSDG